MAKTIADITVETLGGPVPAAAMANPVSGSIAPSARSTGAGAAGFVYVAELSQTSAFKGQLITGSQVQRFAGERLRGLAARYVSARTPNEAHCTERRPTKAHICFKLRRKPNKCQSS